ncbi:hypothetical protein THIOSC13_670006 [uncultured Thiomicrorhabdus sp.]
MLIPPLEEYDFDLKKLIKATLNAVSVKEEIMDIDSFIERCSEDEAVRNALTKSLPKLRKKIEALLKKSGFRVIPLIL